MADMSEEERAAYKAALAAKAEAAAKAKESALRRALEARVAEEAEFTATNRLKIVAGWREVMRKAKVDELRRDVGVLAQSYERESERKDAVINTLMRDLEDAGRQGGVAVRAHLSAVDGLLGVHEQRLALLERAFEDELALLRGDFDAERRQAIEGHKVEVQELRDVMAAMEEEFRESEHSIKTFHRNYMDELKRNHDEELATMSSALRNNVLELYSAFRHAMDNYNVHTNARQNKFKTDKKQDKKNAELIAKNHRLIKRLQTLKDQIKAKIATNDREFSERNKALQDEKSAVSKHFLKLKNRMNKFRADEHRRLTDLTIHSQSCISRLKEKLELAESILHLAEINRKLETEEEKVMPFYASSTHPEDAPRRSAPGPSSATDQTLHPQVAKLMDTLRLASGDSPSSEWEYLENFYKRFNKVLLDKMALDNERQKLKNENANLRIILQKYLDGISVNEAVIDADNPLLIVNGDANFDRPAPDPNGVIPVTELQTLVVTQRMM